MSDPNDRPQFQPPQFQPPTPTQPQPQVAAPAYGAPLGTPTPPIDVAGPPPRKGRSKGLIIGAAVAVVALIGAGVFALVKIGGDDDQGGAASPTEAGENLVKALNDEDILGAIDLLLPGERETFRQPMIDLVDNLKRLEVLGDTADPSKVAGVDIELTDAEVTADAPVADDITTIHIVATDNSSVDGSALPLGDILVKEAFGGEQPSEKSESSETSWDETVTTVEKDGRWYLSLFYTAAESARQSAGGDVAVPDKGVALVGADEPEKAVDQMIQSAIKLDLAAIIGGLNPNEAEALQRYAPIFLDDADEAVADADVDVSLSDATYEVTGSGSQRNVTITGFKLTASVEGEDVSAEFKDGCIVVTMPDDTSVDSCKDGGDIFKTLEDAGVDEDDIDPSLKNLITTFQDAFAGYEAPGIAVAEVDGKWYVSPIATGFDSINGVLGALDSGELQAIIDAIKGIDNGIAVPDILGDNPFDTIPDDTVDVPATDETLPDFTVPDVTFPDITIPDTFPTTDETLTVDDFRDDTESFIVGSEVAAQSGLALETAECETPTSTAIGTTYTCTAWDDTGAKYTLGVEITSADGFTIQSLDPA